MIIYFNKSRILSFVTGRKHCIFVLSEGDNKHRQIENPSA